MMTMTSTAASLVPQISHFAWVVLAQLSQGGIYDGDLIDKAGRNELLLRGLARRDRVFASGPHQNCQVNELTETGQALAMRLADTRSAAHRGSQ